MKNLIYTCIFYNKQYIDMLYLLLESIYIYGDLNDNIDILIYTNTEFKNIICESIFNCNNIIFEINDNYTEFTDAFFARLDLFDFNIVNNYKKILYLDSDIIIIDDINKIFELNIDNIIYANEEGSIDNTVSEAWAYSFFKNDLDKYEDKSAFSSGILLFNNNIIIKDLFNEIKKHVKDDKEKNILNIFHDQPYFIYHCKKNNLINNKLLNDFIKDNLGDFLMNDKENIILKNDYYNNLYSDQKIIAKEYIKTRKLDINNILKDKNNNIIIHFNNDPGNFLSKYSIITNKFYCLKNLHIDIIFNDIKKYCEKYLIPIMNNIFDEEKIFLDYYNKLENNNFIKKIKNFINIFLNKNIKNILFISNDNSKFYELIAFITNKELNIMNIKYDNKIVKWNINFKIDYLNNINNNFINNSDNFINNSDNIINNYDLIFINNLDFENIELFENNIQKLDFLSKNGTIFIINDLENDDINELWSEYIEEHDLKNINLNLHNISDDNIKIIIKN